MCEIFGCYIENFITFVGLPDGLSSHLKIYVFAECHQYCIRAKLIVNIVLVWIWASSVYISEINIIVYL